MNIDHVEIQQLMRQMVDLGIADNLKLWVHSGLVKTRTSGSDLFVPKAYDISGEENDAAQATNDNQPKLVSDGMEFDGSDDSLDAPNADTIIPSFPLTIILWGRYTSVQDGFFIVIHRHTNSGTLINIQVFNEALVCRIRNNDDTSLVTYDLDVSLNTYAMLSVSFNFNRIGEVYVNSTKKTTTETCLDSIAAYPINMGVFYNAWTESESNNLQGTLNDIRIFNTALSATEISAIYNATKSKYGH